MNADVRLARRPMLALCAALGFLPRTRPSARAFARLRSDEFALSFAEFLDEAVPLAEDLIEDKSRAGQDRYLRALASLAAGLREVPVPEMRATSDAAARTFIGANDCEAPFNVLHWRMDPGACIAPHPHIYGNVVTVCLEGQVRVENYEMTAERDFDTAEPFEVRRATDQVLLPGDVNLLNLEHAYVHGFVAGARGARGLDITTILRPKRPTPTLIVGAAVGEPTNATFEGRWRHA